MFPEHKIIDKLRPRHNDFGIGYDMIHTTSMIDTLKGHSGGPMFAYWDSKPGLVGIQSSGSSAGNRCGACPALVKLVDTAKSNGY